MTKLLTTVFLTTFILFLIPSCVDPCKSVNCLNAGTCIDGDCLCSEMYTGADCSEQKRPKRMIINSMTLTNFPQFNFDGKLWDGNGTSPDVRLYLFISSNIIALTDTINNANSDQTYSFNGPWYLNALQFEHHINVQDYDGDDSDFDGDIDCSELQIPDCASVQIIDSIEIMDIMNFIPLELNEFPKSKNEILSIRGIKGSEISLNIEYEY